MGILDTLDLDLEAFNQILEMDESEEDRDFSQPLVAGFFEQAQETFEKMDAALSENKLSELSSLGHFLKGSSATLGFFKIKESCQEIQQYGNGLNVDGTPQPDKDLCLAKIREALVTAKEDTMELKKGLSIFFSDLDAE